ncbi:putative WW domain-containing protein [Helianthus annuus]|nr:putative WW domain-containing protein [Helianthus annuus]KAJ0857502.1 putative WW domain-containing protein [Helianthus annuus]
MVFSFTYSYLIGIIASNPFSEVVSGLISIRVDGKNRCQRLITHLGLGFRLRLLRLTDSLPAASVAPLMPPAGGPVKCNWTEHTSPDGYKYYYNRTTGENKIGGK